MRVAEVLGPSGPVAARLPWYEERPEQVRMGTRVERALEEGRHLLVEAGTGVGKSFAYLVPAILRAGETGEKVVVSTYTIALQEQLLDKDLPFLSGILPAEFSVVLAKGRRNYLCRRRLSATLEEENALFEFKSDVDELKAIADWGDETDDGTLQSLSFKPRSEVWSRVSAEVGNCLGPRCPYRDSCHFQLARRRLAHANVIIANHSLLMSDLALRREGASILPDYQILILDEAHEVEDVAAEHLGLRITSGGIRHLLSTLVGRGGKGLLAAAGADDDLRAGVERARAAAERLFGAAAAWSAGDVPRNLRVLRPDPFPEDLSEELGRLSLELAREADRSKKRDLATELAARANQASGLAEGLRAFIAQDLPDQVYWVEVENDARRIGLNSAPIRVGELLAELLFEEVDSVVLTSATLTVGRHHSFDFFTERLGLPDAETEAVGSPFDFVRQARIHLPRGMPDPRSGEGFEERVAEEVVRAVRRSEGRAFVLFTSYRLMDRVYDRVKDEIEGFGYRVLRQGGGMPRTRLLDVFRKDVSSVLFGTDSFWQGVDVPGESLSHVVITRLPFEVPDRPLVEARTQEIEERGGNAFMEYSLPRAVLRLKQGFGRLIRNHEDRGWVTILDPRVTTKRYGRLFIESLPECEVVRE